MRQFFTLAVTLVAWAGISAPSIAAGTQAPAAAPTTAPAPPSAAPAGDPVVAVVNGGQIHKSDLEAAQQHLPQQYQQMPLETIYDPLLERMVDAQLLVAEAKHDDIAKDPAVQAQIEAARDDVLRQILVERAVSQAATPQKLKAAYEAMKSQPGFAVEEVHAQHILVASEDAAKAIIKQLQGGADFAQLAKEKSTDPSAKANGGDLGYFRREMMVPAFSDAAFNTKPGTIDPQPVKTQFGWHVIKVDDRRTAAPSFEEKREEIRDTIARQAVEQLVADARKGAKVQLFNIDGSPKAP